MDTTPPSKSPGREVVETIVAAGLAAVPYAGGSLVVVFQTAVGRRLNQRRERWLSELAQAVEDLRNRHGAPDFDELASDPRFVDAVVSAARTVDHTHQQEKLDALRNAVVNSVGPEAPDADTQAVLLWLLDRLTGSHLRCLTLWDDPPAWFAARGLTPPEGGMATSRILTVEAGLPEMRGRQDFIMMLSTDLNSAMLMNAGLGGNVTSGALMSRLTTGLGRQLVQFISAPPKTDAHTADSQ